MVARTHRDLGLIVVFRRHGEEVESIHVADGDLAATHAHLFIDDHEPLQAGDTILILDAGAGVRGGDLPEVSRASHHSS